MADPILSGGLTNVQNAFMKLRLQNNPEFAARYFPNVVRHPPSGPLHNVDPSLVNYWSSYPVKSEFEEYTSTPSLKSLSFEEMPKGPLHDVDPTAFRGEATQIGSFDEFGKLGGTTQYSGAAPEHIDPPPASYAEFRTENVPYDTPNSVLDIRPTDNPDVYAETIPAHMYQGIKGGKDVPVTGGQSSTIYMRPDMIADYGTAPKAPRNEMVPAPEWWPNPNVEHVNQADINDFIENVASHEVSHNVSALPEHKGSWSNQPTTPESLTGQATNIDFSELFPGAASKEAQKAIMRLNLLNREGGALGPVTKDSWVGELISPKTVGAEKVWNEEHGPKDDEGYPIFNVTNYPPTQFSINEFDQEEAYNRAKDMEKIKMLHPNNYWKNTVYQNNLNFLRGKFRNFPNQFPGSTKIGTYLKKVEPQVKRYIEKVTGQGGGGAWSPSGADLSPGGGPGQSPTGRDIQGTPFARGGILGAF